MSGLNNVFLYVAKSSYPNPENMMFVAACGLVSRCDGTDVNQSWAAVGYVNFIGGADELETSQEASIIKDMVGANMLVASDVCGSLDTGYYQRQPICTNKTGTVTY